jgi:alkylhydroperoxidase family enzyme
MYQFELSQKDCSIELPLRELVKIRASPMNACVFCIDMYWKHAGDYEPQAVNA